MPRSPKSRSEALAGFTHAMKIARKLRDRDERDRRAREQELQRAMLAYCDLGLVWTEAHSLH